MQIVNYTAEIEGQRIEYFQAGTGPPVILLHGLLGGSFCWRMNINALSQRHTVFAVDLPGVAGNHANRHLDCSMPAQAHRVLLLLEHLKLKNVDMVGSSWGGAIAMFVAAQSRNVRSLVLAAPVNPWSDSGKGRIRFLSGRIAGSMLKLAWPLSRPLHRIAVVRMYADPGRLPEGTIEGYSSAAMQPGRVNGILNTLRSWEKDVSVLRSAIAQITVPTLLVWGTRDGAVDVRSAEPLKRALHACELVFIDGAGHLPFEETPEEFNRLVLDFLGRL